MNFSRCNDILQNMSKVIVGKEKPMELLLVALLAEGHALLEDVPGVGKTLLAKTLATSIGGTFKRVQFTPDLLPADITGFNIYNRQTEQFEYLAGPVMANVLLADEINRTIPRTQSCLLESMEESQVTVDGVTKLLPSPFFVIATQNPIELEGTFPLPEAQLDRFLLRINLGYSSAAEENLILQRFQAGNPLLEIQSVLEPGEVVKLQLARRNIMVSAEVREYIVKLVEATRLHPALRYGASPRGSLGLMRAGQALAALRGREFVLPDDIKELIVPVLAHRLILKTQERITGATQEKILADIEAEVPVAIASARE